MPAKKIAETEGGFQITITRTLYEELEKLALTGVYGSTLQDAVERLLEQEVRRLITSGDLGKILERIKIYPAKEANDAGKKETP